MTKIVLDLKKSVEQNAEVYYEKSKKAKRKLDGIRNIIAETKIKIEKLKQQGLKEQEQKKTQQKREKKWYEKFRWFISSDGFLVIGGRDATSNEVVIKKHTENDDLVLHTDMAGSPFFVIKAEGKKIPEAAI